MCDCHVQGVISQATLQKVADLRNAGVAFVIETGARTATLLQRLPYLPASDALVSENGKPDIKVVDRLCAKILLQPSV